MTNLQENSGLYFAQQLGAPFLENLNKLELI